MKILFITLRAPEINSSVTISNLGLLKGLSTLGHEVTLLTPQVNEDMMLYESANNFYENIHVLRIGNNRIYNQLISKKNREGLRKKIVDLMRIVFYKFSFYDNTISLIGKTDVNLPKNKKFDIVISTSDPRTSHIFAERLIKNGLDYKYWVQHWGDPMYNDIANNTWIPKWIIKFKEKHFLRLADVIVYVSPITNKSQKYIFPAFANKMHFVPLPYHKEKVYEPVINRKLTIGYFGDYNSKIRNIMPLYNFCKESEDCELMLVGGSDIKLDRTENIKIIPRTTQIRVDSLESQCDLLVVITNRIGTQIPGKIYYYAATNKPVLVLLDGENAEEIREYFSEFNRFTLYNNTEESIAKAIEDFKDSNISNKPCHEFSSQAVAMKILSLCE